MGLMRRGRPIMRTAAIVGTASVVSGSVQHHQQQKYAAQDQAQYDQQMAAQQAAAPPPAPAEPDMNAELTQLAQLHAQGILTDEEFAAKKAQILGI
jgi:Short C-terminal domain